MKVFKRIIVKFFILLLVVAAAGGGAACWQAYRQSTPEYTVDQYLSLLIDNGTDRAYTYLDQSETQALTAQEYRSALEAKKYSLYASFAATELEKRRDNNGNEYTDYKVEFRNAEDAPQAEETITVKKQSEQVLGLFDRWKVLPDHCMIKDFTLTVPAGAEVYLDAVGADRSWLVTDGVKPSYDCYRIPTMLPGTVSLVIRHPALESVNGTLDTTAGSADYTEQMPLKESAQKECTELGVRLLKAVYASAAKQKTEDPDEVLKVCQTAADALIDEQAEVFHAEDAVFRNVAISEFATQFGDLVFAEEESGAITTEMRLSYHYVVREDVTTDTEELQEDGTPVRQTEMKEHAGDATAVLTMSYADGGWKVSALEMSVIPE